MPKKKPDPLDRTTYIGSSDAAAIAGLSNWGSPLSVWSEKSGLTEPRTETLRMRLGELLEPIVRDLYAERTGRRPERVVEPDAPPMRSKAHDFIGGHPDFEQLEVKTSRSARQWGEDLSIVTVDDMAVPMYYYVQVQHQLYVTGWEWSDLVVLIGHDEVRHYTIPADPTVIDALVQAEVELWEFVKSGTPPPDEDVRSRRAYLRARFPDASEPERPPTPEEMALVARWREAKEAEAAAEFEKDRLAADIIEAIADASGLSGQVSYKGATRTTIDPVKVRYELRKRGLDDLVEAVSKKTTTRALRDLGGDDA